MFARLIKLFLLVLVLLFVAGASLFYWFTRPIEPVVLESSELLEIEDKIPALVARQTEGGKTLVFTEREINGYLHHVSEYGKQLQFEFLEGKIMIHASVKVPDSVAGIGGQNIRAKGEIVVECRDGSPYVLLKDITSFGVELPEEYSKDYLHRDLFPDIKKALGDRHEVSKIKRIQVMEDKIEITTL